MPYTGEGAGILPFVDAIENDLTAPPPEPPTMVRYINPVTRQLEISTATGHFVSMPRLRQRVLIILMTVRGSSSVLQRFGLEVPDKILSTIQADMQQSVARAFDRMVRVEKSMRIDDVTIDVGSFGRVGIVLTYTDLATRQSDQVSA